MRSFIILLILFGLHSSIFARSSVWKISDGDHTLYFGGTIHLLRANDYPLPAEFDTAYAKADYVVFETDLSPSQSLSLQRRLAQKMVMPAGQTLSERLDTKTYAELKDYLRAHHLPLAQFERLEPWAVMLMLTHFKLSEIGIDQNGVDSHFSKRSHDDGKPQRFLETADDQIDIITSIGDGEENQMILQTLDDMKELKELMAWMLMDWRNGTMESLEKELVLRMKTQSPKMYHHILQSRNEAWMPKLIEMVEGKEVGFVLVGTMHLLGPDGVLERFRARGYRVEYLQAP